MIAVDVLHKEGADWRRMFSTLDEAVRYKEQMKARGHQAQIRNVVFEPEGEECEQPWIRHQKKMKTEG